MADLASSQPNRDTAARLADERKKLALVQEVGRALSSGMELDPLLGLIMGKVTELMEAERATLYLLSDDGEELWSKLASGPDSVEIRLTVGQGIAGWVAKSRAVVNLPDAYADPRFSPAIDHKSGFRTTSMLCVPMLGAQAEVVGVLQVLNKQTGPFLHADEELLAALASQAAVAIANARLVHSVLEQNVALSRVRRDLERKTRELNAVYEVEKEVSAALDLEDLLRRILTQTVAVLAGGAGSIALRQADSSLLFSTVLGAAAAKLLGRTLQHGEGILGWSVQHRTPVIVENPASDPRHALSLARELGIAPFVVMAAPLIDGEEVLGGIEIIEQRRRTRDADGAATPARVWTQDDLKILELIAAQVARAIHLARQRSEAQTKDRLASIGQMLAGVLHDLRTPMTIISGYAQLMAGCDDVEQRERYVELISRQFDLMGGMTKEVLAFSRGDADLVVRKVYMHRFREELTTQVQALVAGRNIVLDIACNYDGVAWFDEQKLLRVVFNLVRNAVEAMPDGGRIALTINATADTLEWTCSDNGPGIPASVRARLFELFATEKQGGTGLGLAIVKKIIDDHGGHVECQTGPDGTRFHFTLPLHRPDQPES
ncbi:MAG: GAF domain-containing protein [Kofleriaceae bacterium]|nr:GAF domain-containing protein [Kofleriaceae bacterium]